LQNRLPQRAQFLYTPSWQVACVSLEREFVVLNARLRLASLWLSQTVRAVADWCLRIFVFLQAAKAGGEEGKAAWYLVTAIALAPFILLAPFNGALSNGLPKRWVLVSSAALCAAVVAVFGALGGGWLWCLGLAAV